MTNPWIESFLYPEKRVIEKKYFPVDREKFIRNYKINVTLTLLHNEYATEAREGGEIPFSRQIITSFRIYQCFHLQVVIDHKNRITPT